MSWARPGEAAFCRLDPQVLSVAAVGSDVLGIIVVLAAAMSLFNQRGSGSKFAGTPCTNNESSLAGPAVVLARA